MDENDDLFGAIWHEDPLDVILARAKALGWSESALHDLEAFYEANVFASEHNRQAAYAAFHALTVSENYYVRYYSEIFAPVFADPQDRELTDLAESLLVQLARAIGPDQQGAAYIAANWVCLSHRLFVSLYYARQAKINWRTLEPEVISILRLIERSGDKRVKTDELTWFLRTLRMAESTALREISANIAAMYSINLDEPGGFVFP